MWPSRSHNGFGPIAIELATFPRASRAAGMNPTQWKGVWSKTQASVALSSEEAELNSVVVYLRTFGSKLPSGNSSGGIGERQSGRKCM